MQGNITKFREDLGWGVILTDEGRKFRFMRSDIYNPEIELVGHDVDFVVESSKPTNIIVLHGTPWAVFAHEGRLSGMRS